MHVLSLVLVLVFFFECTPAPRYKTGVSSQAKKKASSKVVFTKPSKKIPKYDKNKKTIKGVASFYGLNDGFHGKLTANGEVFDMNAMTAAHKTLPLGSLVRVTNLENDKSVIVRINDRGPYVQGRILDCSYAVAKDLDFVSKGTANVRINVIEFGDNKYRKQ